MSNLTSLVIFNEAKLNFDKKLTLDALSSLADVRSFEDTTPEQVVVTSKPSPSFDYIHFLVG
jgi:hypothetical protein